MKDNHRMSAGLKTLVVVINNSNDTLRCVDGDSLGPEIYCIDSDSATFFKNFFRPKTGITESIILPHQRRVTEVEFKFNKAHGARFRFKVGIRLLKWKSSYRSSPPDTNAIKQSDVLWSQAETIIYGDQFVQDSNEFKKQLPLLYDTLTTTNRHDYVMGMGPDKIKVIKDTIRWVDNKKFSFAHGLLKLSNNSNDTLKYFNMDCSWGDILLINDKHVSTAVYPCFHNVPTQITISPHSSLTMDLPLIFDMNTTGNKHRFRVGIVLIRDLLDYSDIELLSVIGRDKRYVVWSNEVEASK
jgi:hypothetical protein